MRVGQRDLAVWSFLVASAHGAGLMALPLVLEVERQGGHGAMLHAGMAPSVGLLASGVHAFGYLAVTGVLALVVYEWLGLRLLRTAWINLDLIWAGALIVCAVLTPLL